MLGLRPSSAIASKAMQLKVTSPVPSSCVRRSATYSAWPKGLVRNSMKKMVKVTLGGMLATSTVTVSSRLPPGRPPLIVTTPLAWGKALARPEGTSPNWKILMPRVPGTGAGRRACGCSAAGR